MATTLSATFETRRDAEMVVERLVQQFAIERTDIFIAAEDEGNSAGIAQAGSDAQAGAPSPEGRDDAELNGGIVVSVDIEDDDLADEVRAAFEAFDAAAIDQD